MTSEKGKLVYSCELAVRWGDMDAYGHVNNALYMRYLEEARVQLIAAMGVAMDPEGLAPVVINVGCTFLKAIVYPDTLRIDCYVEEPGRSSFMTRYKVFSSKDKVEPVAEGYAKVVWIDHRTEKSVPLPDKVRAFILA
ncbi:thioesterase family protein [Neptuniibacter sp. CAU 1671]|uniref:acyl-CoA thioesterase n=1 Tax=Neptuniibacter sp. CAU 1671 TaxID=3032593 RepID=UPI0023DA1B5D|nr:thioesterase family protein [Neptuniibacter sp. CAU 1671]MDF2181193.1 thioesterase family protein [Neptuniibacter sp. CAU 1671]